MEDLDIEDEEEERRDGRFTPLREDAVQCFREHTSEACCCIEITS